MDKELEKVKVAIDMKADAIMDLSSFGKTEEFRKKLIAMSTAMVGTVPVYAVSYTHLSSNSVCTMKFFGM